MWLVCIYKVLTTVDLVQWPIYVVLVLPLGVMPPNITNVLSVNDVREKRRQGGGQSPLTIGEIH